MPKKHKRKTKLARSTLLKYAREKERLELDSDDGLPLYLHSGRCRGLCEHGCWGFKDGFDIAHDIRLVKNMPLGSINW